MKKYTLSLFSVGALAFLAPAVASAQGGTDLAGLVTVLRGLAEVVGLLIPVAFALILLFFFWALAKYVFGDAEDKEKAKNLMIWGVIALFVAASIWGLVAFLQEVFGVDDGLDQQNPTVIPTGSGAGAL